MRNDATFDVCDEGLNASLVTMVMHANFISALLRALCRIQDDEKRYSTTQNIPDNQDVSFFVNNSATSLLDIRADGTVLIRWIGGTEHLGSASETLSRL